MPAPRPAVVSVWLNGSFSGSSCLPACLPAMVLLSGLLPNLCKYWSWESGSSTGPNAGSIKGIQNIELSAAQANEAVVTLVLGYWYDGGVINFKLWTDVAIYYGFIY